MKFLFPEVASDLYKSTLRAGMGECCHVLASAASRYFNMLDKLQKRVYEAVASTLTSSLETLGHRRNVTSLRWLACLI